MADTPESEIPSSERIAEKIPLFFYDLIGRIVPGAVLMLGLLVYREHNILLNEFDLNKIFPQNASSGYAIAMLLLFFACAYFCGIILSSLSFLITESYWECISPLNQRTFADHYNVEHGGLQNRFEHYIGLKLQDGSLEKPSALCAFYVWRKNPNLGIITARSDAELLGARSLVLVSLILVVIPLFHCWTGGPPQSWMWVLCTGIILFSCILTYNYMRKKRVFLRCALFLAVTEPVKKLDHQ